MALLTVKAQFTCKNCGDAFRWEKDLSKHRRLECKKKPYGCPECGQLLSRRDSLRQHLQRHDGGKKYSCKFCNKMFDQQQNLKVHLRIHSGERPYKCRECGREFNQSQNLTTHLRVHSGEKPYICKECGATFRFCSGYRSHVSRSHDPGRGKKDATTQQVHRVSVIAKVSSSGMASSIQKLPAQSTPKENVDIPSPLNAGLLTHSGKAVSPPHVSDVCFSCQVCNFVCLEQTKIVQHMTNVHAYKDIAIKKETENCIKNV